MASKILVEAPSTHSANGRPKTGAVMDIPSKIQGRQRSESPHTAKPKEDTKSYSNEEMTKCPKPRATQTVLKPTEYQQHPLPKPAPENNTELFGLSFRSVATNHVTAGWVPKIE